MNIKLAGYNIETDTLEQLSHTTPGSESPEHLPLTPETISAAYARISRSSKNVTQLRKEAREDVHKTRTSNQKIIFEMSHHSVAEHAVFNFDVIGISRLALEELEKFRLVSYTEKSQRYVTLNGDYVIPKEIDSSDTPSINLFNETIALQNEFYKKSYSILKEYIFDKHPELAANKSQKKTLEGWAKEDARYILSMATEGQVGLTINARNLEHLFRRFTLSQRTEVQEMGKTMYTLVEKITPSLILFPRPSVFEEKLNQTVQRYFSRDAKSSNNSEKTEHLKRPGIEPEILAYTQHADEMILATLLSIVQAVDYESAFKIVSGLMQEEKEEIFKALFQTMEFFDSPPREFEYPEFTFQAVISASNFAQLKRHRIATLVSGDYQPQFGNVIPGNIKNVGLEDEFKNIIEQTNAAYTSLKEKYGPAADYILTNSHCRQVIMKMNLREFYHFVRLRADNHAQWDIRNLAEQLLNKVKPLMPLSTMVLCGKSDFVKEFERIYGRKPSFLI